MLHFCMIRVIMIEDDRELAEILSDYLVRYNIEVINFENPELALANLRFETYDLMILDLSLPEIDGLEVCKNIRQKSDIPIIISSARSDITDKAACFSAGADDFLPKPYESQELVLRINSIIRRVKKVPEQKTEELPKPFECDENKMEIRFNGERIKLTNAEFGIMAYFIKKKGSVISREELLMNVDAIKYESSMKSIDVIISRLRQKIESDSKNPQYILSVRGFGYKLVNE